MKQAQIGFFDESYQHFYFLEYKLKSGALDGVKQVITEVLDNTSTTPTMIAFGKEAWQKFQPNWTPVGLEAFKTLNGLGRHSITNVNSGNAKFSSSRHHFEVLSR